MRTYGQPSGQHKKLLNSCLPGPWILNQKPYSLARITMFPKRSYNLEWSYRCILKNYLRAYGRTDRQTDRQTPCLKGDHSQKIIQRVEVQSQQKKKHAVPLACKKIRQNRSETLIEVPGSTVTYSRLNRKYNICAFTQEIQVFEG